MHWLRILNVANMSFNAIHENKIIVKVFAVCLCLFGRQIAFEILEHLPMSQIYLISTILEKMMPGPNSLDFVYLHIKFINFKFSLCKVSLV